MDRRLSAAWLVLAVCGLVLWGTVWTQLDRTALTRVPVLDEAHYLQRGAAIADGQAADPDGFVMSSLYQFLVAATGSGRDLDAAGLRIGSPPWGLRIAQLAAWALIVLLLWRTARRLMPDRLAWVAPALFILYRPAMIYTGLVLVEIFLALTVTGLAYLLSFGAERSDSRARLWRAAAIGALIGAAALLRGSALLLLVPAWLALGFGPYRWWRGFVVTAAALLVMAPAAGWNLHTVGRPVSNGGQNLYLGNGPEAQGYYVTLTGTDFTGDPAGVKFLSERLGREIADPGEADRIWTELAFDAMREDPLRVAGLWLKKIRLHLVGREFSQVVPLEAFPREAPALRLLVVPYGVIAMLGLAGLVLAGRRRGRLWPWVVVLVVLIGGQSLFFVVSRYRIVLVPILCLLAAGGLHAASQVAGRRRWLVLGLYAAALLATRPWGMEEIGQRWTALGWCNEALRWERVAVAEMDTTAGGRALELYGQARELFPEQPRSWRGQARVQVAARDSAAAVETLGRGILIAESTEGLERDLIGLHLSAGRIDLALTRLMAFLRERPDDPDMLHNLSVALSRSGRIEAAAEAARHLCEVAPFDARGYTDLGILLARGGRLDEAKSVFTRGLMALPNNKILQQNLNVVMQAQSGG